ncbi:MAG TPA: alpha/beta hydrolase [Eoetvoesiella sp.]
MCKVQLESIVDGFRALYAGWQGETSIATMRQDWEAFLSVPEVSAKVEAVNADGVACRWVMGENSHRGRVIFYLHGGGYQIGSVASHHNVMARLSTVSGHHVFAVEYRLAPEHRFPAALDDVFTAYQWLLEQGALPSNIAFCGDSAGGGLVVALLTLIRDQALPLPCAAVLMSPWVDMEASGDSYRLNANHDPVTQKGMILLMARAYMGKNANFKNPFASPIYADLAGLPPMLIQVGQHEVLLDDARTLANAVRSVGGQVSLSIWQEMIHTFQLFTGRLDEADAAIAEASQFLCAQLN